MLLAFRIRSLPYRMKHKFSHQQHARLFSRSSSNWKDLPDYYKVLGLKRDATPEDIKIAFRELAKKFHPDTRIGGASKEDDDRFQLINDAYAVLSDPLAREQYTKGRFISYQSLQMKNEGSDIERPSSIFEEGAEEWLQRSKKGALTTGVPEDKHTQQKSRKSPDFGMSNEEFHEAYRHSFNAAKKQHVASARARASIQRLGRTPIEIDSTSTSLLKVAAPYIVAGVALLSYLVFA